MNRLRVAAGLGASSLALLVVAAQPACSDSGDGSTDGGADAVVVQPCATLPGPVVETVGALSVGRYAPAVAPIGGGRYLVAGGYDFTKGLASSAEVVEPMKSGFTATGGLEVARNFAATALIDPTHVLVAGGFAGNSGSVAVAEIYDVGAKTFSRTGNLAEGREAHTATALADGRVVVLGGL